MLTVEVPSGLQKQPENREDFLYSTGFALANQVADSGYCQLFLPERMKGRIAGNRLI